ncbi:Hypothetical protein FKW44_010984, partial [Caligus rogercresseyi]
TIPGEKVLGKEVKKVKKLLCMMKHKPNECELNQEQLCEILAQVAGRHQS